MKNAFDKFIERVGCRFNKLTYEFDTLAVFSKQDHQRKEASPKLQPKYDKQFKRGKSIKSMKSKKVNNYRITLKSIKLILDEFKKKNDRKSLLTGTRIFLAELERLVLNVNERKINSQSMKSRKNQKNKRTIKSSCNLLPRKKSLSKTKMSADNFFSATYNTHSTNFYGFGKKARLTDLDYKKKLDKKKDEASLKFRMSLQHHKIAKETEGRRLLEKKDSDKLVRFLKENELVKRSAKLEGGKERRESFDEFLNLKYNKKDKKEGKTVVDKKETVVQQVYDLKTFKELQSENEKLKVKNENLKGKCAERKNYINKINDLIQLQEHRFENEKKVSKDNTISLLKKLKGIVENLERNCYQRIESVKERQEKLKNNAVGRLADKLGELKRRIEELTFNNTLLNQHLNEKEKILNKTKKYLENNLKIKINDDGYIIKVIEQLLAKNKQIVKEKDMLLDKKADLEDVLIISNQNEQRLLKANDLLEELKVKNKTLKKQIDDGNKEFQTNKDNEETLMDDEERNKAVLFCLFQ